MKLGKNVEHWMLQAEHSELFGADDGESDTEHNHVEVGQASQGRVRSADRQEDGRVCRRPQHAHQRDVRSSATHRAATPVPRSRQLVAKHAIKRSVLSFKRSTH